MIPEIGVSAALAILSAVKPFVTIVGPSQAGPGERELMLQAADEALSRLGIEEVTRIDVPGRGSGDDTEDSGIRASVAVAIPALQSGSLFAGSSGLLVVDAEQLLKAEVDVIAEVLATTPDDGSVVAVFVFGGAVPAALKKRLAGREERIDVKRVNEKTAAGWLARAAKDRGVRLRPDAGAALVQRFGSDLGAIARALDQLAVAGGTVTGADVLDRFKNRPDEPMWHLVDAISAGNTGEALRRLTDFMIHGHPLQLLAFLQNDIRRRSLAASAPNYETFLDRDGGRGYAMEKLWKTRNRVNDSDLRRALGAVARADLHLKTAPEASHRVTMERLTVALCQWYGTTRR